MKVRGYDGALVGEMLFKMRTAIGMTMVEVARRAGVSRTTVYAVEAGDADPSLSTFVALCLAVDAEPHNVLRAAYEKASKASARQRPQKTQGKQP